MKNFFDRVKAGFRPQLLEKVLRSSWPATRADFREVKECLRHGIFLLESLHSAGLSFVTAFDRSLATGEIPRLAYDFERVSADLPLFRPAGQRHPLCLSSVALGDHYRKLVQPCLDSHRRYCGRHGLDYHLLTETPKNFSDLGPRNPSWAKIPLMNRLLSEGYSYCLILDADTLITNDKITPAELISVFDDSAADLAVGEEDVYFNTGVILGRKTPTVHAFLNAIWKNERYRNQRAREQDALLELVIEYPEIRKKLLMIEPRRFQSAPPEHAKKFGTNSKYLWRPGDFLLHFVETRGAELETLIAHYAQSGWPSQTRVEDRRAGAQTLTTSDN